MTAGRCEIVTGGTGALDVSKEELLALVDNTIERITARGEVSPMGVTKSNDYGTTEPIVGTPGSAGTFAPANRNSARGLVGHGQRLGYRAGAGP